jgi:hypothetical protein
MCGLKINVITCLVLFTLICASCGKQNKNGSNIATVTNSQMSWLERLTNSQSLILTGQWNKAEVAWDELKKGVRTKEEIDAWVKFQTDVLEKTKSDPLKEELREVAIQEMEWHPDVSKAYLDWLKKGVESGLLSEKFVRQKAQELIAKIDGQK